MDNWTFGLIAIIIISISSVFAYKIAREVWKWFMGNGGVL